ncbi:hypothetical protein GF407_06495 [candidate division KSB1 bacterium]|nr:hypothetical protein [candidate division KSB1 bacterium]
MACEAPRQNPLDPHNPDSRFVDLIGEVKTLRLPHNPLQNAKVSWQPAQKFVYTGEDGSFHFENLLPENGWLVTSKSGFLPDSMFVDWQNSTTSDIEFFLNQIPLLLQKSLYTIVLNRYPDLKSYQIGVSIRLDDQDNDIKTVRLHNADLSIDTVLPYNPEKMAFEKLFSLYDLHLNDIEQLIGYNFTILVTDQYDHTIKAGETGATRIIEAEVKFKSPLNYQPVSTTPQLAWHSFDPGFSFHFKAEVYTDEIAPQRVWEKDNIPSTATNITLSPALAAGDYFWIIWCIDEYGNRSRSKPASFTVR